MKFETSAAPHVVAPNSVAHVMRLVLYALVPTVAMHVMFFGPGIIVQLVLACGTALAAEALALRLRHKPVKSFLADGSALITAVLLALCLPPLAPWWLVVSGTAFAILLAKHLFGGLGANPFNPAMVGYAVLLVSFPAQLLQWLPPDAPGIDRVPLTIAETVQILKGLKKQYEDHHQVQYTAKALKSAAELSAKHINDRLLPDKAVDVIDEAGAMVRLKGVPAGSKITSAEIEAVVAKIARVPTKSVSSSDKDRLSLLDKEL